MKAKLTQRFEYTQWTPPDSSKALWPVFRPNLSVRATKKKRPLKHVANEVVLQLVVSVLTEGTPEVWKSQHVTIVSHGHGPESNWVHKLEQTIIRFVDQQTGGFEISRNMDILQAPFGWPPQLGEGIQPSSCKSESTGIRRGKQG